jgi:hypothetical protein
MPTQGTSYPSSLFNDFHFFILIIGEGGLNVILGTRRFTSFNSRSINGSAIQVNYPLISAFRNKDIPTTANGSFASTCEALAKQVLKQKAGSRAGS